MVLRASGDGDPCVVIEGATQLAHGTSFDLADPLARQAKEGADLIQGVVVGLTHAKAKSKHALLARSQGGAQPMGLAHPALPLKDIMGRAAAVVSHQLDEGAVVIVRERGIQRHGLLHEVSQRLDLDGGHVELTGQRLHLRFATRRV